VRNISPQDLVQLIGHIAENGCSPLIVARYSPQLHRYPTERTYHSVLSVSLPGR
jgi:hypothetical protein